MINFIHQGGEIYQVYKGKSKFLGTISSIGGYTTAGPMSMTAGDLSEILTFIQEHYSEQILQR